MILRKLLWGLTLLALLAGCGPTSTPRAPTLTPSPRVTPGPTTPPPPATTSATPTTAPSATAAAPAVGYAAGGAGTAGVRAALEAAAQAHGWQVQAGADPGAPAQAGAVLVVADGAELEAATRAAAANNAGVYFIGLNQAGPDTPLPNLLTLGGPNPREDQAGFAAGLIAGYVTEVQAVTAIANTATATGRKYRNGFLHGVRYSCPRCQVFFIDLTDESATQYAADQARFAAINTSDVVFAAAGAAGWAGLRAAAEAGVWVIGGGGDAYAEAFDNGGAAGAERLVTSVYLDPAAAALTGLNAALEAYAAGAPLTGAQPYAAANGAVKVLPPRVGPEVLSDLDQQDVQQALARLADGSLETGVDPLTGDER
ncbi:MAG: BMP family ABC transporter substrate-binding protein [Anaerolineales bacterium]|nr:BMP family ABC transporter substrate-binding protein [Anaerolineales bacterium]